MYVYMVYVLVTYPCGFEHGHFVVVQPTAVYQPTVEDIKNIFVRPLGKQAWGKQGV